MIAVVHSFPTPVSTTTNLNPTVMVTTAVTQKQLTVNVEALQYPFPANDWRNLVHLANQLFTRSITETTSISESLLRKARPAIATETKTISDSLLRIAKPKIATEVKSISESLLRKVIPKIATQTTSISETQLRIAKPKIATETKTISDSLLRIAKPKPATQTVAISDSISKLCHFFRTLTESKSISDSLLRKPMPKLATQSTSISDSLRRIPKPSLATQSISIAETLLRIAKPKIAAETKSITDSLLRKPIPKIGVQTVAISDSLARFAHFFRTLIETTSISESKVRKPMPKLATQSTSISDSLARKARPAIAAETISIVESLLRKAKPKLATQTVAISDAIQVLKGRIISLSDVVTITDSLTRKAKPKISTQTTSVSDSLLRKPTMQIHEPKLANYYEPLYIYPNWFIGNPYGWTPLINAAANNPTVKFFVVINVNSGPDVAVNGDYTHGIADLQANPNIFILGYVFTSFGTRSLAAVEADIDNWASFYPSINGIMLDQMDNVTGHESYYSSITAYAHSHAGVNFKYVFSNPGTATISSYVGTVDTILIFEDVAPAPSESTLQTRTFAHNYGTEQFGMIVHTSSSAPTFDYLIVASEYVGYIGFTDGSGGNPYNVVPSYIETEAEELRPTYQIKDSQLRTAKPSIATQTVTIAESLLRKVIPKLATQTVVISDSLVRIKGRFYNLIETISISDSLLRKAKPAIPTQTTTISSSLLRKAMPKLTAQTISISDSIKRKCSRVLSETVTISDSINRFAHFFRTVSDTTSISDSLVSFRIKVIHLIETVSISDSLRRLVGRNITENVNISDSLKSTGGFTPPPPPPTYTPGTFGWAGEGERVFRPIPQKPYIKDWRRSYLRDWTMKYRRLMERKPKPSKSS